MLCVLVGDQVVLLCTEWTFRCVVATLSAHSTPGAMSHVQFATQSSFQMEMEKFWESSGAGRCLIISFRETWRKQCEICPITVKWIWAEAAELKLPFCSWRFFFYRVAFWLLHNEILLGMLNAIVLWISLLINTEFFLLYNINTLNLSTNSSQLHEKKNFAGFRIDWKCKQTMKISEFDWKFKSIFTFTTETSHRTNWLNIHSYLILPEREETRLYTNKVVARMTRERENTRMFFSRALRHFYFTGRTTMQLFLK